MLQSRYRTLTMYWRWYHLGLWVALSLGILGFVILVRSFAVIQWMYELSGSLSDTTSFVFSLLQGLFTLFTPIGTLVVVLFSFLVSLNGMLLVHYIKVQRQRQVGVSSKKMASVHVSGLVAAAFGIGCASCGTAILLSALSVVGAGSLLAWLPLHGEEFGIFGVALLAWSAWYVLGKLDAPKVC